MINEKRISKPKVEVIGDEGTMGQRVKSLLEKALKSMDVSGMDIAAMPDELNTPVEDYVNEAKKQNPDVVILSTSADTIEDVYPNYVEGLGEEGKMKFYVNINSVQDCAKRTLYDAATKADGATVIINVHPYFGPAPFDNKQLGGKKLIFCGVDVIGGDLEPDRVRKIEQNWKQIIDNMAQTLPESGQANMEVIDLSTMNMQTEQGELTGTKLHDYLSAYAQAPYHILRLALNKLEQKQKDEIANQITLPAGLDLDYQRVTPELTAAIISQNEYAQSVQTEFNAYMENNGGISADNIKKFMTDIVDPKLKKFQQELFEDKGEEFYLITGNVKNMINWAKKQ